MDKKAYSEMQQRILFIAREVRFLDLDCFLKAINKAETIAPLIDPTKFVYARKNLEIIKKTAAGLKKFQNSLPDISEIIEGLTVAQGYRERIEFGIVAKVQNPGNLRTCKKCGNAFAGIRDILEYCPRCLSKD